MARRKRSTDGPLVAEFLETFCRLSKGEWYGQPLVPRPWQKQLLDDLFELAPGGLRKYQTAYVGLPRKNGKSTLCAGLGIYGLIADGEPGAEVYSCAGDREQASIVFREAKMMVNLDPELSNRLRVYQRHIEDPVTGSIYRVLSADAKLQQGLNPSFVIFDEVHVQPNFDLWTAMTQGSGAREQPLVIGITTAGFDQTTLAWWLYEKGRKVESGEDPDPGFFFRWWQPANEQADYRDPAVWAEANPAFGDFLKPESFQRALGDVRENDFRRFRLNQWTSTVDAWLPHGAWAAIRDAREVPYDQPIVVGFDGAWANDSTAMVGCTIEEEPHLFLLDLWEKPADEDDWRIDLEAVEYRIEEVARQRPVRQIQMDPFHYQEMIQRLLKKGLPVVEFPSNSLARMVPACQEFYQAVLGRTITQDGDPRLARHVANAVVKSDRNGTRIIKESAGSPRKIDAAVAAVLAYDAVRHVPDPQRAPELW